MGSKACFRVFIYRIRTVPLQLYITWSAKNKESPINTHHQGTVRANVLQDGEFASDSLNRQSIAQPAKFQLSICSASR